MNTLRLRPHNIVIVRARRAMADSQRESNDALLSAVFGPEFPARLDDFIRGIPADAIVQVVSSNDDICEATQCPFYDLCDAGRFREVQDAMIAKAPPDAPKDVIETLRHSDPDREDAKACQNLGIEIGKSYELKGLRPTMGPT